MEGAVWCIGRYIWLAPGELRHIVTELRYGSLLQPDQHPLDCAVSGKCHLLTRGWLRDYHYDPPDAVEKLHDVRTSMVTEGPRWWWTPENGDIVWMRKRFWEANGRKFASTLRKFIL